MLDWKTLLIGALVGALLTVPMGIFVNLNTPWVKQLLDNKRRHRLLNRRLPQLVEELKILERLKDTNYLIAYVSQRIVIITMGIIVLVVGLFLLSLENPANLEFLLIFVSGVFGFIIVNFASSLSNTLYKVQDIEKNIAELKSLIKSIKDSSSN